MWLKESDESCAVALISGVKIGRHEQIYPILFFKEQPLHGSIVRPRFLITIRKANADAGPLSVSCPRDKARLNLRH